jgi:hypothetical protein
MSKPRRPDPLEPVLEIVGEIDRKVGILQARTSIREDQERPSPAEAAQRVGLPADLASLQTNVWRRLSPARNRWPEILEFDQRVAELEMRQAEKATELRELNDREIAAPAADADRLATWQLDGEKGPRPEPELPGIKEQIRKRQEDWEALTRAIERVLVEKAALVEKHRSKLIKEADAQTEDAHARYLKLIHQAEAARDDLRTMRRAGVWARLYPSEELVPSHPPRWPVHLRAPLPRSVSPLRLPPAGCSTP